MKRFGLSCLPQSVTAESAEEKIDFDSISKQVSCFFPFVVDIFDFTADAIISFGSSCVGFLAANKYL